MRQVGGAARAGDGCVALVHGEAGIGKTALLRRLAREQVTGATRLFWGGCDALFTPRPLSPLQEVAWEHGGALAEKLRLGAPRDEIFQAFLQELRHPKPPALVVFELAPLCGEAALHPVFPGRPCSARHIWRVRVPLQGHEEGHQLAVLPPFRACWCPCRAAGRSRPAGGWGAREEVVGLGGWRPRLRKTSYAT